MIGAIAIWAQIQLGVVVRPETVTVGEHFSAVVRVRAPLGAKMTFPAGPDSGAAVDTAGPSSRHDTTGANFTESTVTYVLAPWDTGAHALALGDVIVHEATGDQRVPLGKTSIYVRSVLPADTTLRKPKALRPLIVDVMEQWRPWIMAVLGLLAFLLLLFLARLLWRWRQRHATRAMPLAWAEGEFQRVEAMRLLDTPHPETHAILMVDVVRGYLVREYPAAQRSATTRQLARALREESAVPVERVIALLERIDLLKFAAARMPRADAEAAGTEARALVRAMDERARAQQVAANDDKARAA